MTVERREIKTRCIRWTLAGAVLAFALSVSIYVAGFIAFVWLLLPVGLLLLAAAATTLCAGTLALMRHPAARKLLPTLCGLLTFSVATIVAVTVGGRLYEHEIESKQASAVQTVQRFRSRTGRHPDKQCQLDNLPDGVRYWRRGRGDPSSAPDGYTLSISDRFILFGEWRYDSASDAWAYWHDGRPARR